VVVVDEGIDVHDYQSVAFHVFSNVDPGRDLVLTEGPLDVLDHGSSHARWGSKVGIDATRKWPEEGYERGWPEELAMDPMVSARIDALWPQLGLEGLLGPSARVERRS